MLYWRRIPKSSTFTFRLDGKYELKDLYSLLVVWKIPEVSYESSRSFDGRKRILELKFCMRRYTLLTVEVPLTSAPYGSYLDTSFSVHGRNGPFRRFYWTPVTPPSTVTVYRTVDYWLYKGTYVKVNRKNLFICFCFVLLFVNDTKKLIPKFLLTIHFEDHNLFCF